MGNGLLEGNGYVPPLSLRFGDNHVNLPATLDSYRRRFVLPFHVADVYWY